jgi:hypothetical protein
VSSALLQIETEMAQRLEAIPFFAPFTILVDPRKNIVAEIQSKIGKLKTLIAPKIVGADDNHPNVHGTYFDEIRAVVGVFQNPLLRADHAEPLEICEEIHKAFKNWSPDSLTNPLNPRKPGIEQIADAQLNIFNCNFETRGGFVGALPVAAPPVATYSEPDLGYIFTSATEGAAIFYTTNGSNPSPRNGTLAYGPRALAPGTIKARAFLAGYLRSELLTLTVA